MIFNIPVAAYNAIKSDIVTTSGKPSITKQINHYYILNRLVQKQNFAKDKYAEGVPFCTKVLKELFQKGSAVSEALKYLSEHNFIVKVKRHQKGVSSAKYKLHPSIENQLINQISFFSLDSSVIRSLNNRASEKNIDNVQLELLKNNFKINDDGIKYLNDKYGSLPIDRRDNCILIERKDINLISYYYEDFFAVRPDIKSRVYSTLTQTSKSFRKFINFQGKEFIMTDLVNSQVLLCIPVIINKMKNLNDYNENNLPADFLLFKELCEQGKIYEYLQRHSTFVGDRKQFKERFFMEVFFCKNASYSLPIKIDFKNLFPTVLKYITLIKRFNHAEFSLQLQRFEADIMVDKVFNKMILEGKRVLTLHDAIVCNSLEDLEYAEQLICAELRQYNLKPSFNRS